MEDDNKMQDPQNQSSEHTNSDIPDSAFTQKENTYWENQNSLESGSNEQLDKNSYDNQELSRQNLSQQTIAGGQPAGRYQEPRKSKGKLVAILLVFLLVLGGAAAAFAFKGTLANTFALMTKSPSEYYAYVEKKTFQDYTESFSPYMAQTAVKKGAYDITADVTLNKDALNSILQTSLGVSFTDLESMLGLTIDNIGIDALVAYDEDVVSNTMGVRLNNVNVITMEMFMNMLKDEILIRFPELSQAYLKESMATEGYNANAYQDLQKQLTPERIADLLDRYSSLIIDHVNNVELEKNSTLSLETLTVDCNKLTVTLSEEDMNLILQDILKEAREDKFILEMLPAFAVTTEEYQSAIDEAVLSLQDPGALSETPENFIMQVYVDKQGKVIGREFSVSESTATLSYTILTKDNFSEYNVNFKDETDVNLFSINGTQTKDQDAYDGKLTFELNDPSAQMLSNFSFDVTYEDIRTEFKNGVYYQYGNISLSSLDLMGLQMNFVYGVENNIQNCNVDILMGASSLVNIKTTQEYLENYTVTPPADSAEVYTTDQMESYLATMNIDQYITNLSEQLGVDLYSIYESLFGFSY